MAISSMSEYILEPFLRLNALLKELLSLRDKKRFQFKVERTDSHLKAVMSKNRGNLRSALKDVKQKPNILQNYI